MVLLVFLVLPQFCRILFCTYHLCLRNFVTHIFVTYHLAHTMFVHTILSHNILHTLFYKISLSTQFCHTASCTHPLLHTCTYHLCPHYFVTRHLCMAGVVLEYIYLRFTWQGWHLVTSSFVLRGRHGTYGAGWRA